MKENKCKHCGAINSHFSFQCSLIRKPIKVKDVTEEWKEKQAKIKSSKTVKPLAKKSDKQKKIDAAYRVLRGQFLKDKPICEAQLHVCTGKSTQAHHCYFGSNKRKHYLHTETWKALCAECHAYLHDKMSKEEQLERGLRILD